VTTCPLAAGLARTARTRPTLRLANFICRKAAVRRVRRTARPAGASLPHRWIGAGWKPNQSGQRHCNDRHPRTGPVDGRAQIPQSRRRALAEHRHRPSHLGLLDAAALTRSPPGRPGHAVTTAPETCVLRRVLVVPSTVWLRGLGVGRGWQVLMILAPDHELSVLSQSSGQ
jgi:hypothetical protein